TAPPRRGAGRGPTHRTANRPAVARKHWRQMTTHEAARVRHPHEEYATEIYRSVNTRARCISRAAEAGVRQFIFVSTVLVHGRSNDGRAPFSKKDDLTPRGLYGLSKAAAEAGLKTLEQERGTSRWCGRPWSTGPAPRAISRSWRRR